MKKSVILTFAVSFLIVFLGLIGSIIISRTLGPEIRGNVAAAMLWPNLLLYLGSFGTYQSLIFFFSKDRSDSLMLGTSILCSLINSIVSIIVGIITISFFIGNVSLYVKWYSFFLLASLPFAAFSQFAVSILQAKRKFIHFNILRLLNPVVYLLSIIFLYLSSALSFSSIILSQTILNIIAAVVSILFLKRYIFLSLKIKFARRAIRIVYQYGFKVWAGDLSQGLNVRADQILIANLFSPHILGVYVVALSLANFTSILATSYRTILFPVLSKIELRHQKIQRFNGTMKNFILLNFLIVTLSMIIVPFAVRILYGDSFEPSISIAIILLGGFFFLNIKTVIASGLQGLGAPTSVSKSEIAGLIVLLVLIYPMSKTLSVNGAAIAVSISFFVQFLVGTVELKKYKFLPA